MASNSEKLSIKPKKLKGNDGYKTFSIKINKITVSKIEEICSKTGHTRNELIGIFEIRIVTLCNKGISPTIDMP